MGFLVDPFSETVRDVSDELEAEDEGAFLDHVRRLLSEPFRVEQLNLAGIEGGFVVMFMDNFGMLRGPGQRFWRYRDGPAKIAGKVLLLAVDPRTGFVAPLRTDAIDELRAGIVWLPEVRVTALREFIDTAPGRFPQLKLAVTFSDERLDDGARPQELVPPAEPAPARPSRWVVSATAGGVKAVRYELAENADELRVAEAVTAKDLEELRPLLPGNLVRVEPQDDDPPEILEYLVTPAPIGEEAAA